MKSIIFIFMMVMLQLSLNAQWMQTASTPQGAGVTDMVVLNDGTLIVTTASFNWPNGQDGGIRRSSNGGTNWQNVVNCYNARTLYLGTDGVIFASYWNYPIDNESLYRSTNGGIIWSPLHNIGTNDNIFSIAGKDNNNTLFIGTRNGVKRSTDAGTGWTLLGGMPANTFVYDLDISFNGIYIAAGTSKGAYISSNNGSSWVPVTGVPQTDTIFSVKFMRFVSDTPGEKLLMGSGSGKLCSSDESTEFLAAQIVFTFFGRISDVTYIDDFTLHFIGLAIAGWGSDNSNNPGYAYSTDRGATWIQNNNGLTNPEKVSSVCHKVSGNTVSVYTGLFENTSYGAKVSTMTFPIGIQTISNEVPGGFLLSQNYPNPFNPTTNIEFAIPKASFVKLVVYDMLGREVETLLSKDLKAGTYKADWNASRYTSGVYFYKLQTEGFIETKKMVLTK